jgi:divalent metal cation (Fe/Co/Zn/Cd) transporter
VLERGLPSAGLDRAPLVLRALQLVTASVVFGLASGAVSVIAGLRAHSLGVLAIGLGVLADVTGSAMLTWRFRAEQRRPAQSGMQERRAAIVVAAALAVVGIVLTAESVTALASGTRPGTSAVALIAAGVSLVVLTPLAWSKRRLGARMGSPALHGDGTLSAIGAATSLLALAALVLNDTLGWWWADRVSALVVAGIAVTEAWHTAPVHHC